MKDRIRGRLHGAANLDEVGLGIVDVLQTTKQQFPDALIWYVSGMITSEGPQHIERNIQTLENYTEKIRATRGPHVFSPTDVFSDELFARVDAAGAKGSDYMKMWRVVLNCGMVHGVFFTPRWSKSLGAKDEYEVALKNRLQIVDMDINDII